MENKGKIRIIVTFAILFMVLSVLLLLIFLAGKKSYVVRFELNGGTLISGSLEQHVIQGQDAVPPTVVKDGAFLRGWSASTSKVTKDMTVEAVWDYETTAGLIYSTDSTQNFAEIAGAHKYIQGEVYLGSYYGDKKILGIQAGAFADCKGITKVYLLNGLLHIGDEAFRGCTSLSEIEIPKTIIQIGNDAFRDCESLEKVLLHKGLLEIGDGTFENCVSITEIEIPKTVTRIGAGAFRGCETLETLVLNEGLLEIGAGAFENCVGLREVVLPSTVVKIDADAFLGCEDLVITVTPAETENESEGENDGEEEPNDPYAEWEKGWYGDAEVLWPEGVAPEEDELPEESESTDDSQEDSDDSEVADDSESEADTQDTK